MIFTVLIPKAFIHHFLRTTKHSTVIWHSRSTFPVTSTYTTKIQSTSEQPTRAVIPSIIPPSPLPSLHQTSYPDVTTHLHTNLPEASISCFICNDTVCGDQDLQQCTKDTKYCMNTFTQYPDGTKTINRRFVDLCYNDNCLNRISLRTIFEFGLYRLNWHPPSCQWFDIDMV